MSILVRLPASLQRGASETLTVDEPVRSIAELIVVLETQLPELRAQLADALLNFAVNDEMVLHGMRDRALADGDVVEIVPTISGGSSRARTSGPIGPAGGCRSPTSE